MIRVFQFDFEFSSLFKVEIKACVFRKDFPRQKVLLFGKFFLASFCFCVVLMFHLFTFFVIFFIIIFSCCFKDLTILVDCFPVPEDDAAAVTHFSSHHQQSQQANEEEEDVFVSISKLQTQPVLRKRAKRSLLLGGAALYFGHRLFGRYSEGYLVDSCVSASVFAFKAALFAGLFGLLPVAVGRQAGRYWLGHHRPPKVIEVTVDPDKVR